MSACVEWQRARSSAGYGQTYRDGRVQYAHRIAYADHFGPIPDGLVVMHTCDNPPCVNVDHLVLGTIADNNRDMVRKGRGGRPPVRRGSSNHASRLTPDQVVAIRADHRILREVARDYGVHLSTISRIRRGEKWTVVA